MNSYTKRSPNSQKKAIDMTYLVEIFLVSVGHGGDGR